MKHKKSIVTIAFATMMIFTACSHKSTPTAAVPKPAPAQFNMVSSSANAVVEGQKTYTAKCGKCHGLKDPSDYTSSDWNSIMRSMAPKAKLTDEEKSNVMAYVTQNARVK